MSEEQRVAMSQIVYIYEKRGSSINLTIVNGILETFRTGVRDTKGITHSIAYNTLTGLLSSGAV